MNKQYSNIWQMKRKSFMYLICGKGCTLKQEVALSSSDSSMISLAKSTYLVSPNDLKKWSRKRYLILMLSSLIVNSNHTGTL